MEKTINNKRKSEQSTTQARSLHSLDWNAPTRADTMRRRKKRRRINCRCDNYRLVPKTALRRDRGRFIYKKREDGRGGSLVPLADPAKSGDRTKPLCGLDASCRGRHDNSDPPNPVKENRKPKQEQTPTVSYTSSPPPHGLPVYRL